jgi:hypothetical protein
VLHSMPEESIWSITTLRGSTRTFMTLSGSYPSVSQSVEKRWAIMNAPSLNGCHNDQRCDQVIQAVGHASAARDLASLSTGLFEPAWPKERMATWRGLAQGQVLWIDLRPWRATANVSS